MTQNDRQIFETTFHRRVDQIAESCVACGKCYEACPITDAAKIGGLNSEMVTSGVRDILRMGNGSKESETWATACVLSGECINVCDYGVNPRLMLAMARMASSEKKIDPGERKSQGADAFKALGRGVKVLSKIQLTTEDLGRLGQGQNASVEDEGEPPDYVFYTGCNVLKTPHIALLCLDIMDALDIRYRVLGGPSHCCGILQYRAGDLETSNKMAKNSIEKFINTGASEVLSWCPTCQVQFSEVALPTYEGVTNSKPFEMTPFILFLERHLDQLRKLMVHRVEQRVALHLHPGVRGLPDAAKRLLSAVPGVEFVELNQPAIGLMSNALSKLPDYKKELQYNELNAAEAAGVDALAAVYHADHRELCAHERDWPFKIINILEVVGASLGIYRDDYFKKLKLKQDTDAILEDCADMLELHKIDREFARPVIEKALLGEQPLPLRGE
jgi:heterodisulfide reductase subunit D